MKQLMGHRVMSREGSRSVPNRPFKLKSEVCSLQRRRGQRPNASSDFHHKPVGKRLYLRGVGFAQPTLVRNIMRPARITVLVFILVLVVALVAGWDYFRPLRPSV